jgi:quercetin dioxygenase-like cupin family protein
MKETDMNRMHQPGQAAFRSILPEEIDWQPFPAFPPSVRLAVLVGHPSEPGPYVIRVKAPGGTKLMPHRHPEDRIYTVMSGVFYIGLGERFDGDEVKAFPPGSLIVLPGNTPHFHWAKSGEYVTQVTAIGPLGLEYLEPMIRVPHALIQQQGDKMKIQNSPTTKTAEIRGMSTSEAFGGP